MTYSASDFVNDIETVLDSFNVPEPDLSPLAIGDLGWIDIEPGKIDPERDVLPILVERISQRFAVIETVISALQAAEGYLSNRADKGDIAADALAKSARTALSNALPEWKGAESYLDSAPELRGFLEDMAKTSAHTKMRADWLKHALHLKLMEAAPDMCDVLRDVSALLPNAGRMHPQDMFALQTRVVAALAKAGAT
jgi:hypothetical protein